MICVCRPCIWAALLLAAASLPCTPLAAQDVAGQPAAPVPVADFPQTVPAEPAPEVAPAEASNVSPAMTPVENLKPSGSEPDVQSGQRRYRGHGRGHRRAWTPPIAAAEAMPTEAVSQVAFVPSPLPKPRAARPSPTTGETLSSSGWLALIAAALALAGLVTVFVRRERIIARKRPIAKMAARMHARDTSEGISFETWQRRWSDRPSLLGRTFEAARKLRAPVWFGWPMRRMHAALSHEGAFFRPAPFRRLPGSGQLAALVRSLRAHRVRCGFGLGRNRLSRDESDFESEFLGEATLARADSSPAPEIDRGLLKRGYHLNWAWRRQVHLRPLAGIGPKDSLHRRRQPGQR